MIEVIEAGAIYGSAWGRYRVHRLDPGDQVVLADLERVGAFIVTPTSELGAGRRYELVTPSSVAVRSVARAVAATPAPIPPASPPPLAPPSEQSAPILNKTPLRVNTAPLRTLGAIRPGSTHRGVVRGAAGGGMFVSTPDRPAVYWLPCARLAGEGEQLDPAVAGEVIGPLPHVFFIAEGAAGHVRCPACRPQGRPTAEGLRYFAQRDIPQSRTLDDHPNAPGQPSPTFLQTRSNPAPATAPSGDAMARRRKETTEDTGQGTFFQPKAAPLAAPSEAPPPPAPTGCASAPISNLPTQLPQAPLQPPPRPAATARPLPRGEEVRAVTAPQPAPARAAAAAAPSSAPELGIGSWTSPGTPVCDRCGLVRSIMISGDSGSTLCSFCFRGAIPGRTA